MTSQKVATTLLLPPFLVFLVIVTIIKRKQEEEMEKGSAPPPPPPILNVPEAPPTYEESMHCNQAPFTKQDNSGGGGMVPPLPPPQQQQPAMSNNSNVSGSNQTPVVVQYVSTPNFGPQPVRMTCPKCQNHVLTSTSSEPGALAWVLAGVLCVVGLCPCAFFPFCIEQLKSVTHKCPVCKTFLGRYKGGL